MLGYGDPIYKVVICSKSQIQDYMVSKLVPFNKTSHYFYTIILSLYTFGQFCLYVAFHQNDIISHLEHHGMLG